MVKSEQHKELDDKWFSRLQAEIAAAPVDNFEAFRVALRANAMGPAGKEGIDEAD